MLKKLALSSLAVSASGLVVSMPQQPATMVVVQQSGAQQYLSAQPSVLATSSSAIFPTSSLLAANAKIEAAKAAAEAKRNAFLVQSGVSETTIEERAARAEEKAAEKAAKEEGAIAGVKKGVAVANKCADAQELLEMGSGASGRMVSKSCSAQLNQAKIMKAQKKAAEKAALLREAAKEAELEKGPPKDMLFGLVKF